MESELSRRCWRCLKDFACDLPEGPPDPPTWWLCEACQGTLIGTTVHGRE
jgi:hypothetical protein